MDRPLFFAASAMCMTMTKRSCEYGLKRHHTFFDSEVDNDIAWAAMPDLIRHPVSAGFWLSPE
jgi:hypothetical protein